MKLPVLLAALSALAILPASAKPGEAPAAGQAAATPTRDGERARLSSIQPVEMKPAPGGGPGKVWVNTQARVYHCEDDPLYGRTRKGAYMTEARARATGARPLMDRACS